MQCLASFSYLLSSMSTQPECHHYLHISHSNPWSSSPTCFLHIPHSSISFLSVLVLPRFLVFLVLLVGVGPVTDLDMMLVANAIIQGESLEELRTTPLRPVADSPVRDRQARQLSNKPVPIKYKTICVIMCVLLAHQMIKNS